MSERTPVKLRMYLSRGTEKAILLVDTPKETDKKVSVWLPKSMIDKRIVTPTLGQLSEILLWLPQWLVEKHNLWEFEV